MADPPSLTGAVKLIIAPRFAAAAVRDVGAPAVVIGVTLTAVDAVPEPAPFTARR